MAKDKVRVSLSRAVGKICAYLAVGNVDEAKRWAKALVGILQEEGLL